MVNNNVYIDILQTYTECFVSLLAKSRVLKSTYSRVFLARPLFYTSKLSQKFISRTFIHDDSVLGLQEDEEEDGGEKGLS